MKKVSEANERIRHLIDQPRRRWILSRTSEGWNQLLAALDVIDDTAIAIDSFKSIPASLPTGERYLLAYGLLEALYIQQNAVEHLCHALDFVSWTVHGDAKLLQIREVRHRAAGHPSRKDKPDRDNPTFHQIVRISLEDDGFDLVSWTAQGQSSHEHINLMELARVQEIQLTLPFKRLISLLQEEEMDHRRQFRDKRLAGIFDEPGFTYSLEKLGEGRTPIEWEKAAAGHVREVLKRFVEELKERGLGVDTYPGVAYRFERADYALCQLERHYSGLPGDIVNDRASEVYSTYLRSEVQELRELVADIDAEYQKSGL